MQAFMYMEMKIYLYDADTMTKKTDIPIFCKKKKTFEIVCSNYDSVLTMTYFWQDKNFQQAFV